MRRFFLIVLLILIAPVCAYSTTFQDYGDFAVQTECVFMMGVTPTDCGWEQSPSGDNSYWVTYGYPGGPTFIRNAVGSPMEYSAATTIVAADYVYLVYLYDNNKNILYATPQFTAYPQQRIEMKMSGGQAHIFVNGTQKYVSGILSQNPSYVGYGSPNYWNFGPAYSKYDDIIWGGNTKYIFGAPEQGYVLKKNMINPSAYGLYNSDGVLQTSTFMFATYGRGNNAIPPDVLPSEDVIFMHYGTQQTYATHPTGINYSERFYWNIKEALIDSGAPYGEYVTTIAGTNVVSTPIMYVGDGASVSWDRSVYSTGDTGVISYSILGGYWDSVTYSYRMVIQDIYGTVIKTEDVSTQTGNVSIQFSDTNNLGVYYAILKATPRAGGEDIWMNYDMAELQAYISFSGYVMNAETGAVISNAYVNVTQLGTTLQSQSLSSGAWNSSNNWIPSNQFNITTIKSGYTTDVRLLTPLGTTGINLNISLVPLPPANVSVSVGGIVRDNVYGNPIQNATVSGVNNTATATSQTNIAGYYRVDNMKNPDVVNMSAEKTGYMNDTTLGFLDASITSSFARKDLVLDPVFIFTLNIVDSATSMPIPVVGVLDSLGNNQTTSTGTFTASYPYSSVILYLSSDGYDSKSVSYIIDSDRTETTTMTKTVTAGTGGKLNLLYPHEVRLIAVDINGQRLSNIGVTTVMLNSTIDSTNWWATLFGIPTEATPINGTELSGITDSYGSIVFPMVSSGLYRITFLSPALGINKELQLYPDQSTYTYMLATTATAAVPNMAGVINSSLSVLEVSPLIYLNMSYVDSGHTTANTTFFVKFANTTPVYTKYFPAIAGSNQTVNTSYPVTNTAGDAYTWGFAINNTQYGWINQSQGITMKGPTGILYNPFVYKGEW